MRLHIKSRLSTLKTSIKEWAIEHGYIEYDPSKIRVWGGGILSEDVDAAIKKFAPMEDSPELRADIVNSYRLYGANPTEYFLYELQNQTPQQRSSWLFDIWKDKACLRVAGERGISVYKELERKYEFYQMTKQFYYRDACKIEVENDWYYFEKFVKKHLRFIAKPMNGSYGAGTHIEECSHNDYKNVFERLLKEGAWMIEELIIQHDAFAAWNESSVNSVRIPMFRYRGGYSCYAPFLRTGRKGMVVDNAGSGGIFAFVDNETGVVITDGRDESGMDYVKHPDSGITYKGWQIPDWCRLIELAREVHKTLPLYHKYVAFDFAYRKTKDGSGEWVLVEGNWGQFIVQQTSSKIPMKKDFEKLMYH